MNLTDEKLERLKQFLAAWGAAEKAIKITEQANNSTYIPAILELRYAGRKIVRAFSIYIENGDLGAAHDLIQDAIFDCHRARHDATDTATAYIAARLELAVNRLGITNVREQFPNYGELRGRLASVRRKIANVRQAQEDRHSTYEEIEDHELPEIMELFEQFLEGEGEMRRRRMLVAIKEFGAAYGWILATLIAIFAIVLHQWQAGG